MNYTDAKDFLNLIEFCPTNLIVYNSIYDSIQKNNLSPFVGAGLSAFVYPQWGELFNKTFLPIVKGFNIDQEELDKVEKSVNKGEYTSAAEKISNILTPSIFNMLLKKAFSATKLKDKSFDNENIGYLVKTIKNTLYYTTNYDHIIELAYLKLNQEEIKVLSNKNFDEIEALFRERKPALFKIHGDIETLSEDIILTESSYEEQYNDSSDFVKTLNQNIKKNVLLFLGTSFNDNFLAKILKKPIFPQGTNNCPNLAIIGVYDKNAINELVHKLGDMHITSIYYNINSNEGHAWVGKILNWLKSGICPKNKEELQKIVDSNPYESIYTPLKTKTEFSDVNNQIVPLINFLNAKTTFVWWELSGVSGSGKSRYAIELSEYARKSGWLVNYYCLKNIANIKFDSTRIAQDTLYIFDDADYYAFFDSSIATVDDLTFAALESKIKRLMCDSEDANKKVRVLFICSNNDKSLDDKWWNGIATSSYPFEQSKYIMNQPCIIEICEDDVINIIKSFSERFEGNLPENILNIILKAFKKFDSLLQLPLIAMILVEAYFTNESENDFSGYALSRLAELEKARAKSDDVSNTTGDETAEMQKIIQIVINEIFKEKIIRHNIEDSPKYNSEIATTNSNINLKNTIDKK